jgi:hypothetical protein
MTHDWQQTRQLLIAGSVPAIEAFFAVHPLSELRAIGYTWEWGQSAAAFYLVANTAAGLAQGLIGCRINPLGCGVFSLSGGVDRARR